MHNLLLSHTASRIGINACNDSTLSLLTSSASSPAHGLSSYRKSYFLGRGHFSLPLAGELNGRDLTEVM